jgi:hypothetical protein
LELKELGKLAPLRVVGLPTRMFKGRVVHKGLASAVDALGLEIEETEGPIIDDVIVFHNPAFLKYETDPLPRLSCDLAIIVCHENFVTPQGADVFDAEHCLTLLADALLCRQAVLAPVSQYNLQSIERWGQSHNLKFDIAPELWPNICDFPLQAPNAAPRDRRGRHSRPGPEKFPTRDIMRQIFPAHAERVVILGADDALKDQASRNWRVHGFGEMDVGAMLGEIDFFVYFTHPNCQESFGRVIAEAIAAGKFVITNDLTAGNFSNAVTAATPEEVDGIIKSMVKNPKAYGAAVKKAQKALAHYAPERFLKNATRIMKDAGVRL